MKVGAIPKQCDGLRGGVLTLYFTRMPMSLSPEAFVLKYSQIRQTRFTRKPFYAERRKTHAILHLSTARVKVRVPRRQLLVLTELSFVINPMVARVCSLLI
jgi:hypothetical protein